MKDQLNDVPAKRLFFRWDDSVAMFIWASDDLDKLESGEYFLYELKGPIRVTVSRVMEEIP